MVNDSLVTRALIGQQNALQAQADSDMGLADHYAEVGARAGGDWYRARGQALTASGEELSAQADALDPLIGLSRKLDLVVALLDELAQRVPWSDSDDVAAIEDLLAKLREASDG